MQFKAATYNQEEDEYEAEYRLAIVSEGSIIAFYKHYCTKLKPKRDKGYIKSSKVGIG